MGALYHKQSVYQAACALIVPRVHFRFPCAVLLNTCAMCHYLKVLIVHLTLYLLSAIEALGFPQCDVSKTCHHRQTVLYRHIHILLTIMDL